MLKQLQLKHLLRHQHRFRLQNDGNVAMYENGYVKYTEIVRRSPGNLTPYPTVSWSMHATGKAFVVSTNDGSKLNVVAGTSATVIAIGDGSTLTVVAGTDVRVSSTGDGSTLSLVAGTDVVVFSTGNESNVDLLANEYVYLGSTGVEPIMTLVARTNVEIDLDWGSIEID